MTTWNDKSFLKKEEAILEKKGKKPRRKFEQEYKYAGYFLIPLILLTFFAFYKTYFDDLPGFAEPVHLLIHAHVLVLSLWILVLIAQPFLILYRKNKLHRTLGKVSYVLVPLVIITSIGMMADVYYTGRLDNVPLIDNLRNLIFPFASNVMMIIFFVLAIRSIRKGNIASHIRYMTGMAIILLDPTITRIALFWYDVPYPFVMTVTYAFIDTLLIGLILSDVWRKLNFRPYLLVTGCFLFFQAIFYASFYL